MARGAQQRGVQWPQGPGAQLIGMLPHGSVGSGVG